MKQCLIGTMIGFLALTVVPVVGAEQSVPPQSAQPASVVPETNKTSKLHVNDYDRETIQFVVKMHIASLSQQRADLFSKTFTEKTQEAFETPEEMLIFFSLRYIPVVFAKTFHFDGLSLDGAVPVQHGYLVDKRGKRWRLSYGFQHMGEGDWRIISTVIELATGDPA